jgi:hypothetical protein
MNSVQAVLTLILLGSGNVALNNDAGSSPAFIPELHSTPEAVVLRTMSRGCTKKSDFRFMTGRNYSIKVQRLRKDRCKKAPKAIELRYSYEELGLVRPLLSGDRIVEK